MENRIPEKLDISLKRTLSGNEFANTVCAKTVVDRPAVNPLTDGIENFKRTRTLMKITS
jgi:hypothetical protein